MTEDKQTDFFALVLGLLFILTGLPKVIGFEMAVANFNNWHLGITWRYIVGTTEVILGVFMFIPILKNYAAFLYFCMMPAAFMVHLVSYEYIMLIMPVGFGILTLVYLFKNGIIKLNTVQK